VKSGSICSHTCWSIGARLHFSNFFWFICVTKEKDDQMWIKSSPEVKFV